MNLQKEITPRSEAYKKWVRSHHCLNHRYRYETGAHHENQEGKGGKGIKCSDFRTLPLCVECHNLRHSQGKSIWEVWRIDPEKEIEKLNSLWVTSGRNLGDRTARLEGVTD